MSIYYQEQGPAQHASRADGRRPIRQRENPLFTLWVETLAVHAHAAWAHRGR